MIAISLASHFSAAAATSQPSTREAQPGASSTTKATASSAPPDAASRAAAEKLIHDLLKDDYAAARTPSERLKLARKLLQHGADTHDDPASRYVLLDESADIAASCGESTLPLRAVTLLSQTFDVNSLELKSNFIAIAARSAITPQAQEGVARDCLLVVADAISADDYDTAARIDTIAETTARDCKQVDLLNTVTDKRKEIVALRSTSDTARVALAKLANTPDDPALCAVAGRFLCFVKADWDRGLPLLARSDDASLKSMAESELALPAAPAARTSIGDGWWNLAQNAPGVMRDHLRERAAYWYRQAVADLAGITRIRIEQRLTEMDAAQLAALHLLPGLCTELYADRDFSKLALSRIDNQIDFDWGVGPPAANLPKDDFSIRWTGLLRIVRGGRYHLLAYANTWARVAIDDKLLIDDELTRKRTGQRVIIDLPEGIHPIRVEFWDGGGEAKMRLLWIPPGETKDIPIPPSAFVHERSVDEP